MRKKRNSADLKSGFTLLEVMIALAVVGGLLVTLLYTLNYHLGIAARHEAVTIATMLGKEKLYELTDTPSASSGRFPEPYSDYSYTTLINSTAFSGVSEFSVSVIHGKEKVVLREFIREDALKKGD